MADPQRLCYLVGFVATYVVIKDSFLLILLSFDTVEQKLLMEEDEVVRARIESLMQMFLYNNTDDSSQMILNSIDTYKKLLVCEPEFQNKVSCQTIESLVKSLLILSCHRKEYDHLNSMVSHRSRNSYLML